MRLYALRFLALAALVSCGGGDNAAESGENSAAVSGGTEPARPATGNVVPAGSVRLRVVASNLSSGNDQSYTAGHGQRILQGLGPDVILMQEFNYGTDSDADIATFVASLGPSFTYTREARRGVPNGVVSRFPIVQSGTWDDPETSTREFVWARIDVPGPKDLWAVSMHLLTANPSTRNKQAQALVAKIHDQVPEGDYLVFGGDFNTDSRGESCLRTFAQIARTSAPYPADGTGVAGTSRPRAKPYDWVLAGTSLDGRRIPTEIGSQAFPNGLVFDSRKFAPLTDVAPVLRDDSNARNMQHMAVVRDFAIPGDDAAPSDRTESPAPVQKTSTPSP
jgi:endonuclease/exonuclease/phosphatase family metal-dependent hydrolase